ncbi:hypothetical protein [Streptomyces carpinensis]|uniref:hypothetical protein n=1 Tax=Streptomyces carpinensis TaxID=66369 RepID=UPI000A39E424|nr:hypothetical protein [Streptomyces carpinensis]
MIARRHQVALVLTAVLAAGAACQAEHREQRGAPSGHAAPAAPGPRPAAGHGVRTAPEGVESAAQSTARRFVASTDRLYEYPK